VLNCTHHVVYSHLCHTRKYFKNIAAIHVVYLIEMLCIVVIIPHLSHKYMKNTQLSVVSTKVIDLVNNDHIVQTRTLTKSKS
jgi:hypothetical protein